MLGAAPRQALTTAVVSVLVLLAVGVGTEARSDAHTASLPSVRAAHPGALSGLDRRRHGNGEHTALGLVRRVGSTAARSPEKALGRSPAQKTRAVAASSPAVAPRPQSVDRKLAAYESATDPQALPRVWAVQVAPGTRGWFDRALLKRVRKDGINALTLKISDLGRRAAGRRAFDRVRAFAASQRLYLIAVLPAGKARTPAGRRALAECSKATSSLLRCAVQARSASAAAALAREHDSVRQLVALYVPSPSRVAQLAALPSPLARRILVIAPLHRRFDGTAWDEAIGQTAVSASVYMGAAPQAPNASPALRHLAATLGGGIRKPPSKPSSLTASTVTQTSMTLTWQASTDLLGVAGYRLFRNGTLVGTSPTNSFSFVGLSCGTSYRIGVAAYDRYGNTSRTATLSHSTSACSDTQPPTPSGLAVSTVGRTSVTVLWDASGSDAGYRLFLNGSQVGTTATTSYSFTGLTCGTSYAFAVAAYDAAGNVSDTASVSQATSACPDTQPPSTPSGLATSSVLPTSLTLSWHASTDDVGVAGYRVFLNGNPFGTSASTSFFFTGLLCATRYTLGVAAYDAAGNVSGTATISQSTGSCTDTQPPSTPSGLSTSAVSQTSLKLSWHASSDNVGVVGYRLFLNGSPFATSTTTSFTFTGLTCGTSYAFGVAAYDGSGNVSGTATKSQSTSACSDTQAPSTPTGLATSSVTQTSTTLSWSASTDNVGVTGYRLFLNGSQIGTSATTSYDFTGLTCATSYTLGVAAYDAAGNVSGTATTTATTAACATGTGLANIFVSPSGSDSSCSRSSSPTDYAHASGHVCATPAKACQLAQSGDTVILEDGTYSGDFTSCTGHQSYASNVVFEPEPGHECPMPYPSVPAPWSDTGCDVNLDPDGYTGDGLDLTGGTSRTCGVTGNPLPDTLAVSQRATWINHLTIKGIYVGGFVAACAAYIELDDDVGSAYYIRQGAYHFYILGGDYGNETDASQPTIGDTTCGCNNWPPAEDVRVENTVEHDFVTQGSGHGDGIFIQPSYDVQIVENVLARDDCIPIYVNYATGDGQPVGVHGLRIIGNVVHTDTIHNGGARCYQGISLGNNDQTDTIVAFNSVEMPIRRSNSTEVNQNIQIVGNVAGEIDAASSGDEAGCGAGTTASYNVLMNSGASNCGDASNVLLLGLFPFVSEDTQPNSPSGTNQYFTAPLGDYALASGSAGAAAVGRVPTTWCDANPGVCPSTDVLGNPRPNPAHPSYYDAGAYENR